MRKFMPNDIVYIRHDEGDWSKEKYRVVQRYAPHSDFYYLEPVDKKIFKSAAGFVMRNARMKTV